MHILHVIPLKSAIPIKLNAVFAVRSPELRLYIQKEDQRELVPFVGGKYNYNKAFSKN